MELTKNQILDFKKYFVTNPVNFSPEYNKYIVEKTIKATDEMRKKRRKAYWEQVAERCDAAASFIRFLEQGGMTGTPAEKYFGRQELARLQGRKIKQRIIDAKRKLAILEEVY